MHAQNPHQGPGEVVGEESVFLPRPPDRPRNPILLFSAFFVIILVFSPDAASRLIFLVFAGLFMGLFLFYVRWEARRERHPLGFSPSGLDHLPLATTYGVRTVPWTEIRELDLFYNARARRLGLPWLRIHLWPGPFRDRVRTPACDRLFGGDINLLLDFQCEADSILHQARAYRERHAEQG